MQVFTVTYTIPAKGTFTEKGLTREGVDSLLKAIVRVGGYGSCNESTPTCECEYECDQELSDDGFCACACHQDAVL